MGSLGTYLMMGWLVMRSVNAINFLYDVSLCSVSANQSQNTCKYSVFVGKNYSSVTCRTSIGYIGTGYVKRIGNCNSGPCCQGAASQNIISNNTRVNGTFAGQKIFSKLSSMRKSCSYIIQVQHSFGVP